MKFLLSEQITNVSLAQQELVAKTAFKQHQSLRAKKSVTQLLTSTKGLTASFSAGVLKGLMGGSSNSQTSVLGAPILKQLVSAWLASQGEATQASDITESN